MEEGAFAPANGKAIMVHFCAQRNPPASSSSRRPATLCFPRTEVEIPVGLMQTASDGVMINVTYTVSSDWWLLATDLCLGTSPTALHLLSSRVRCS